MTNALTSQARELPLLRQLLELQTARGVWKLPWERAFGSDGEPTGATIAPTSLPRARLEFTHTHRERTRQSPTRNTGLADVLYCTVLELSLMRLERRTDATRRRNDPTRETTSEGVTK